MSQLPILIPVQYGRMRYPDPIRPVLVEVAGHFGKESIPQGLKRYSLHTEYAAGERPWAGNLIRRFPFLLKSQTDRVPRLWTSSAWAKEFAEFVTAIVADNSPPEIVEIHPPFARDCAEIDRFLDLVAEFQAALPTRLRESRIVVENRHGTRLSARFLIATSEDVVALATGIDVTGSPLEIVLDIPQLLHGEHVDPATASERDLRIVLEKLRPATSRVAGVHLWARTQRGGTHVGDLDEYFGHRKGVKEAFLTDLGRLLDDGSERYFVPEVNYGKPDAIEPMIRDLQAVGFEFTSSVTSSTRDDLRQVRMKGEANPSPEFKGPRHDEL